MRLLAPALLIASVALVATASIHPARGAGSTLKLTAIGDSLTSTGVTEQDGWVGLLASNLNTRLGTTTETTGYGRNGATSEEVLTFVESDATVRDALRRADLITYQAGINDFLQARARFLFGVCGGADNQDCLRDMVSAFVANWDQIVAELTAIAPSASFRTMDIYYPTAGYDQFLGMFGTLDPYLSQMNGHIWNAPGGLVADVHTAFNGTAGTDDPVAKGYILPDAVHPTWLGHIVIFFRFQTLGYDDVAPHPWSVGGLAGVPNVETSARAGPVSYFAPEIFALATLVMISASTASVARLYRARRR